MQALICLSIKLAPHHYYTIFRTKLAESALDAFVPRHYAASTRRSEELIVLARKEECGAPDDAPVEKCGSPLRHVPVMPISVSVYSLLAVSSAAWCVGDEEKVWWTVVGER